MSVDGAGGDHRSMLAVYAQVGENYRQIDDLRLRLLALLPLATGTGLLVLLGGHSVSAAIDVPAGVFGMVATLSLYFYELHGVEKCAHYIYRGARLENDLGVPGSFTNRPTKYSASSVNSCRLRSSIPRASPAGRSWRCTRRARVSAA
jgi:hypothetical protein